MHRDSPAHSRFSDRAFAPVSEADAHAPHLPARSPSQDCDHGDADEPLEADEIDSLSADPVRFAGASAALGSCFGVMIAAIVLGSSATVSGPRELRAQEGMAASLPESTAIPGALGAAPLSAAAADSAAMSSEDAAVLAALEREVLVARARLQSARAGLSMSRNAIRTGMMDRVEALRRRADAEQPAANPPLFAGTLEQRSRRRALDQLAQGRAALDRLERQSRQELELLEDEVHRAESALAAWRERRFRDAMSVQQVPDPLPGAPSAASALDRRPGSDGAIDLFTLIARHRARLTGARAEGRADSWADP